MENMDRKRLILLGSVNPLLLEASTGGFGSIAPDDQFPGRGKCINVTAFLVVSINTIIAIPQFFSLVMLGEGVAESFNFPVFKAIIPVLVTPLAYLVINKLTPLHYSFGATDIIIWLTIVVMQTLRKQQLNLGMKLIVLSQLIFGITWLNQVPFLDPYDFGLGSLSVKVKEAAVQIGFSGVLSLYANVLFLIFVSNGLILWIFLVLHTERWTIFRKLHLAQLEAQKSRSGREVLHLVHDLKTPLSAIEGLISLIELRWPNPKLKEYCIIAKGLTMPAGAERNAVYTQLEKIAAADAVWLPISHAQTLYAYRPNVQNFYFHMTGITPFAGVSKQ